MQVILSILYKAVRKLNMGKTGMSVVYRLNKKFNYPSSEEMTAGDYAHRLNSLHKDVQSSALRRNEIVSPTCDLQIIIPVYNVGRFLRECLDSILSSVTKYTYHLVIVNDGSTDCSGEILSEYENDSRVTIINQGNKGLSGARNTGLEKIFGRYVTFVDSDDLLAPDAITNWLDAAYRYDADVVEGSFLRRLENGKVFGGVKWDKEAVENKSKMQGVAWLKIYKAELWQDIIFPVGYWYEDTIICGLIQPLVKKYVQIPDYVYYYTLNKSSISFNSRGRAKSLDNLYITKSVLNDADKLGLIKNNYEHYYSFFLYQAHTDWDRTYLLGGGIEYLIFKELCLLFNRYFPNDIEPKNLPSVMVKALRCHDFDSYRYSNLMEF